VNGDDTLQYGRVQYPLKHIRFYKI
jgi:hypothetical protein